MLPARPLFAAAGAAAVLALAIPGAAGAAARPCSAAKVKELLAPGSSSKPDVVLGCSVKLGAKTHTITKRIVLRGAGASGVTVDCGGSTIRPTVTSGYAISVRSQKRADGSWSRPESVRITNCVVFGAIRVWGLGKNGEAADVRASSRSLGHTKRAQAAAPRKIHLDRLKITSSKTTPVYFAPGVTHSSLTRSELKGKASSVAVYLDAESGYNTIRDNYIHVDTGRREEIAVDGSAHNRIIGNRLSSLNRGGIFLYRNCGEGGTVRHQPPEHNQIIGNIFYYKKSLGFFPSVWVASRNGLRLYCGQDRGFPFGSSKSNKDYARHNVLAENQIYKLSPKQMLRISDKPNYLYYNRTVSEGKRTPPGCFVDLGDGRRFYLRHGKAAVTRTPKAASATRYACSNNKLSRKALSGAPTKVSFRCARSGSNAGCSRTVSCPAGKKLIAVRAACNLETTSLAASAVRATAWDALRVVRKSDKTSDGACAAVGKRISQGQAALPAQLRTVSSFAVSCKERDKNGGDCVIAGEALCR